VPDHGRQVVGHQGEVALAHRDAVVLAGHQIEGALERLNGAKDAPDAPDRRQGRVIGMERQFDLCLLRDRDHAVQKIREVFPQPLLGHDPVLGQRQVSTSS
jgi:hypothetical protein